MGAKEGNLVDAVTSATGGRLLFSGAALETEWHLADAYIYRLFDYHLRGTAEDKGHTGRVWVKNEHHVVWRDEDVLATSPDLIALLDATTGIPLSTRGDVVPGRSVLVFAMPVLDSAWRTEQGTQLLGPRHFGFDFDYVPLEDRPVRR